MNSDRNKKGKSVFDLGFWSNEDDLLMIILFPLIRKTTLQAAKIALDGLLEIGVGVEWDLVNEAALRFAQDYSYDLVSKINGTTRRFIQETVSEWIELGLPLSDLENALDPVFGPVRAEMIASSETTRVYAEGNSITWKESGVVQKKRWTTARDEIVCPVCGELHGQEVELDSMGWVVNGSMIGNPPAHVRCRCWLKPVI